MQPISDKGTSPDSVIIENQSSSPAPLHNINENTLQAMQHKSDQETSLNMTTAENRNPSPTSLHNVADSALQPISERGTSLDSVIVEKPVTNPASPHNVGENPLQISQSLSDQATLPDMTTHENQNMSPLQNGGENALEIQQSISYKKTSPITNIVENETLSPISPHNIGDNTVLAQKSPHPGNNREDQNSNPACQQNGGVGENMLRIWRPIFDQRLSPEIN